jgi:hypothetical protein
VLVVEVVPAAVIWAAQRTGKCSPVSVRGNSFGGTGSQFTGGGGAVQHFMHGREASGGCGSVRWWGKWQHQQCYGRHGAQANAVQCLLQ